LSPPAGGSSPFAGGYSLSGGFWGGLAAALLAALSFFLFSLSFSSSMASSSLLAMIA